MRVLVTLLFLLQSACTLDSVIQELHLKSIDSAVLDLDGQIIVTSHNKTAVHIKGNCSPESMMFQIRSHQGSFPVTCEKGLWEVDLDLSGLPEGSQTIEAVIEEQNLVFQWPVLKDTTPPSALTLVLESGAPATSKLNINAEVGGADIDSIYLSESSACIGGGTWQKWTPSTTWLLSVGDEVKTVYLKARDAYGNESACISENIVLDTTPPEVTLSYAGSNAFSEASFSLTITPSEDVTGLSLSSFLLTNATLSDLVVTGSGYTVTVTPSSYGVVQVTLNADAVQDVVGLGNSSAVSISRTYSAVPIFAGYIPASKMSDDFLYVSSGIVSICNMTAANSCVAIPAYTDASSAVVTLTSARLLLNGDVVAVGYVVVGGYRQAVAALYDISAGTWAELNRFSYEATTGSDVYSVAVSPSGSLAMLVSAKDSSGILNVIVRELRAGEPEVWQSVDVFNRGGSLGSASEIMYTSDESLIWAGKLYNSSLQSAGLVRRRDGTDNSKWSTVDQYVHGGVETGFMALDVFEDKIFLVGWIGGGTRQMILRQCLISTSSCTNLRVESVGGTDTYPNKIMTTNGTTLYISSSNRSGPSGSSQSLLLSYDVPGNQLTQKHAYQLASGWNSNPTVWMGFGIDGRIWKFSTGYDGATTKNIMKFYSKTGDLIDAYVF
ncbi:Ig-like domain-containing protein [Bdellovibrio sp.]|uniref:Ig-like domain-containing protein n=1 Tax=Bdellovibrio sp. TaxID=28201 RepID=UPI0039E66817